MPKANAFKQYMVELINELRLDPDAVFDRIVKTPSSQEGHDNATTIALQYFDVNISKLKAELEGLDPAQPLAWNDQLADAALKHSERLQKADEQSHQVAGEAHLGDRVQAEGYQYSIIAENVYSYAENADHTHNAFVVDWGPGKDGMQDPRGHRDNLTLASAAEIGIGVVEDDDSSTAVGPYIVTQDLGARFGAGPILLGVGYKDKDNDGFYSMGEGAKIKVKVQGSGKDKSDGAGGYAVETDEGAHKVKFAGKAVKGKVKADVTFEDENVKIDIVDKKELHSSGDVDLLNGKIKAIVGLGQVGLTLSGSDGKEKIFGTSGDDVITGEGGKDKLRGGEGDDQFVFGADDGKGKILDWNDGDEIVLLGATSSEVEISDRKGKHAVIDYDDTTIIIKGEAGHIDMDDLIFG